jgi:Rieske Fe-S protein
VKYDGKDYPMTGSAPGGVDMIAIKRINANTYEATQKKAGKVTANTKVEISKDGKVTTITSKGTDSTSFVAVYDKQ